MSKRWDEELSKEYQPTLRLRVWENDFQAPRTVLQQWWVAIGGDGEEDGVWVDIPRYGNGVSLYGDREERRN